MLTEVQNDMLAQLDAQGSFKFCAPWQGNLDELLKTAQKTPSAHVALAAGVFGDAKTIPAVVAPLNMGWDVIIVFQCLKDRSIAANEGYGLIEAVVKPIAQGGLTGLKTQGGLLWPRSLELLDTINGITAYAIRFEIERNIA